MKNKSYLTIVFLLASKLLFSQVSSIYEPSLVSNSSEITTKNTLLIRGSISNARDKKIYGIRYIENKLPAILLRYGLANIVELRSSLSNNQTWFRGTNALNRRGLTDVAAGFKISPFINKSKIHNVSALVNYRFNN